MAESRPSHAKKLEVIKEIQEKIKNCKGMVIAKYTNLSVKQMSDLRLLAKEKNAFVKVYKDSLFKRATNDLKIDGLTQYFTEQNVYIFSDEEGITAPKLVNEFAKKNPDLILKAGIFDGTVMDTKAINEIASLPSKDELYSMFASALIYPLRQFMLLTKEIAKTKTD